MDHRERKIVAHKGLEAALNSEYNERQIADAAGVDYDSLRAFKSRRRLGEDATMNLYSWLRRNGFISSVSADSAPEFIEKLESVSGNRLFELMADELVSLSRALRSADIPAEVKIRKIRRQFADVNDVIVEVLGTKKSGQNEE